MPNRRTFLFTLLAPLAVDRLGGALLDAQIPKPPAGGPEVPPLSYSCLMHAEVVQDSPGKCPICGMTLVAVRLALVYSCTIHSDVTKFQPGRCPRCGRDLIRVTKAVTFTCRVHKKVDVVNPGTCPICKRTLVEKYSIRPHGDHNPKHGGSFFMASNNWHLEVTHPAASVFRLYIYNEYSKPFSPPGLAANIVETRDPAGKVAPVSIPFKKTSRGYYEARMPGAGLPSTIAAKIRFEPNDKDYRFDFIFVDYSKEPVTRPSR
jgi:hypothetical protein